jgi:transposase InsO family protein
MKIRTHEPTTHERWANLRFSVVGHLLAAPPTRGDLQRELARLATMTWRHPVTAAPTRFGLSTIERWYYQAKNAPTDPVGRLRKKRRKDRGRRIAITDVLAQAIHAQHAAHRSWSYQLHYDNLVAWADADATLGAVPAYATVRRYMRSVGLLRRRKLGSGEPTDGTRLAEARLDEREVRSYENEYVNGLWHLDFHHGKKKVLVSGGKYVAPLALGIVDDHSRLVCHLQWYFAEDAENLVHGLAQAIQKRGQPRSLMTDQGSAMKADEVRQGLARLGIVHEMTLPHSPYQNAKQESFWAQLEGRFVAMLNDISDLTLARLNDLTQAWVEHEYNRKRHSELGTTPLRRFLDGKDVGLPSPASQTIRQAFCAEDTRTQRKSDGTVSIDGQRFEIPSRYRHLDRVTIRRASWDLSWVHLVDDHGGEPLCRLYPLDKAANAEGLRRTLGPLAAPPPKVRARRAPAMPPLLAKLVAEHAATGLPPAYLPKDNLVPSAVDETGGAS